MPSHARTYHRPGMCAVCHSYSLCLHHRSSGPWCALPSEASWTPPYCSNLQFCNIVVPISKHAYILNVFCISAIVCTAGHPNYNVTASARLRRPGRLSTAQMPSFEIHPFIRAPNTPLPRSPVFHVCLRTHSLILHHVHWSFYGSSNT